MRVTVEVVGDDDRTLDVPEGATYGDLLEAAGFSIHEATAVVEGSPVPEDREVDPGTDRVRVLRLIQGG